MSQTFLTRWLKADTVAKDKEKEEKIKGKENLQEKAKSQESKKKIEKKIEKMRPKKGEKNGETNEKNENDEIDANQEKFEIDQDSSSYMEEAKSKWKSIGLNGFGYSSRKRSAIEEESSIEESESKSTNKRQRQTKVLSKQQKKGKKETKIESKESGEEEEEEEEEEEKVTKMGSKRQKKVIKEIASESGEEEDDDDNDDDDGGDFKVGKSLRRSTRRDMSSSDAKVKKVEVRIRSIETSPDTEKPKISSRKSEPDDSKTTPKAQKVTVKDWMQSQLKALDDASDSDDDRKLDSNSEYEKQRLQNIAANDQFLAELGLLSPIMASLKGPKSVTKKTPRPKKPAPVAPELIERRTSARLTKKKDEGTSESSETFGSLFEGNPHPSQTLKEPLFQIGQEISGVQGSSSRMVLKHHSVFLEDPNSFLLSGHGHNCYSFSYNSEGTLLATAGSGGIVSIFDISPIKGGIPDQILAASEDWKNPIVSLPIHRRWASSVCLLENRASSGDTERGYQTFVLSASDDAHLVLCQLKDPTSSKGDYSLLPLSKLGPDLHHGGIFSMDAIEDRAHGSTASSSAAAEFLVLSGSKDATVGLSRISNNGLTVVKKFEDFSETPSVIKTVKWKETEKNIFAASGNDRCIRIFDIRTSAPTISIPDFHDMAINTVDFHPQDPNLLLSSGFDQKIQLIDLRSTQKPLFTLQGHHIKRGKPSLTSPIFYLGGTSVVTIGDNTANLFRYSVATGLGENAVDIGFTPTCIQAFKDTKTIAAAHGKAAIWIFCQGI